MIQVVEWKNLSDIGKTEATPALLTLVFCIMIVNLNVTVTQNHVKSHGKTRNHYIFCLCGLFSAEFMFTKAWFHARGVLHGVSCMYEVIVELYCITQILN